MTIVSITSELIVFVTIDLEDYGYELMYYHFDVLFGPNRDVEVDSQSFLLRNNFPLGEKLLWG